MATGVVIRLRNLPLAAGTLDIRQYFKGLRIPDGGVHIIGGDDGTAFILFTTDEDARQAMMLDSQTIHGMPIKLMLSSHSEMKTVIEDSQRSCEELRGLRPPEPPITNMANRSTAAGRAEYMQMRPSYGKPPSPKMMPPIPANDLYIEMDGMPLDVTENEIVYFFAPIPILAVRNSLDEAGRRTGNVIVMFKSVVDKYEAMKKDHSIFENCYVKLQSVPERHWQMSNIQMYDAMRSSERKRPISPNEGTPKRSRAFSPLRSDNCVEIRGLPSSTSYSSVGEFFTRLRFADGGLYVEMDGKNCKGRAFVEFLTYADFKEALLKDGDMFNGKQIRVISVSKQNMMEQIRIHRKYIKSKQDEEFLREKERKQMERKIKEEKKREHQLRKQKEMDEWLRRQHQKEHEERKRRDLERNSILKSMEVKLEDQKKLEEERRILQMQLDKSIYGSSSSNQTRAPPVSSQPVKEESVSGAGEMDIENASSPPVETPKSSPSVSAPFPMPAFGSSGAVMGAPGMPFVMPPPGFPPPPMMPPGPFPPLGVVQDFSAPPPPLPTAIIPPPPVPPLLADSKSQSPQVNADPVTSLAAVSETSLKANGTGTGSTTKDNKPDSPTPEGITQYLRVANSPFGVTEDQVRSFFSDISIVPDGIQFVSYNDGRRTGHIFIKCASAKDSVKAAQKNDQRLCGRNVLVQVSSLEKFKEIHQRLTNKQQNKPYFHDKKGGRTSHQMNDSSITNRILLDSLTCACIGNLPWDTKDEDLMVSLQGINFVKNTVVLLKELDGRCKGEAYLELISPDECAKFANLHGALKVRGVTVRILPLSRFDMIGDIQSHDKRMNAELALRVPDRPMPMGFPPPLGPPNSSLALDQRGHPQDRNEPPFLPRDDRFKDYPPMLGSRDAPLPPMLRESDMGRRPPGNHPPPPGMLRDSLPPLPVGLDARMPPFGHPDFPMRPRSPTAEDLMRLRGGPPGMPFPPNIGPPRMPPGGPPFPPNPHQVVTVKMSNLNFKVTQEDILEFFHGFDPIPDSVRLMYNKGGKPTGDGVISFPNIDAARAALDKRRGVPLLKRPTKLFLE